MAERIEIADEMEALAAHCRLPLMEPAARGLWLRDWCEDLAEYPIEAIRLGCRKYRQSGQTKFPTPGQLMPLVKGAIDRPKPQGDQRIEPWKAIGDEEYAALSLRDKIRHHRILAHEAYRKAGPMWRNGMALAAEDMPEIWRSWTRRAEDHEAEAERLSKALRQAQAEVAS